MSTAVLLTACSDDPCPAGSHAEADRCVPRPDSGAADAGTTDGGSSTDAGTDAAMTDAGPCPAGCMPPTPVCDENTSACVECLGEADCATSTNGHHCDEATHTCVACLADTDCTTPAASHCDDVSHTCVACDSSTQCAHLTDTTVCDTSGESGVCVECTIATESAKCGTHSCNPATHECTTTNRNSVATCEPCVADSECTGATAACIPLSYMGTPRDSAYCLPRLPGSGICERPFVSLTRAVSLSGAPERQYCGPNQTLTTCEAVLAAGQRCTGGVGDCHADGARCEAIDGSGLLCTYSCGAATECRTDRSLTECLGSGSNTYCQPPPT